MMIGFDNNNNNNNNSSVGSNSSCSPGGGGVVVDHLLCSPAIIMSNNNNNNSPNRDRSKDTCFKCKHQGHWAADCPNSNNQQQQILDDDVGIGYSNATGQRCFVCDCGVPCSSFTSKTTKNPGRLFYRCDACKTFKWRDQLLPTDFIDIPICACRAGPCRIQTNSPGALKFFVCNIPKGQGACSFYQPVDGRCLTASSHVGEGIGSPRSTLTNHESSDPDVNYLGEENFINRGLTAISHDALDTFRRPESHVDGSNVSSAIEDVNVEHVEVSDFEMEEEIEAAVPSERDIHLGQVEFWRQMEAAEISLPVPLASSHIGSSALTTLSAIFVPKLTTTPISQQLGIQNHDWLGRLIFSPSRCLPNPLKHNPDDAVYQGARVFFLYPGSLSAFDPVDPCGGSMVSGKVSFISSQRTISPGQDAYPSSLVICTSSGLERGPVIQGNAMMSAISGEFAQVAMRIQDKFLSLLESFDINDHASMAREAASTFDALERLKIDFQPLREKVTRYIEVASSLAGIESKIRRDQLNQEQVVDDYNREKLEFDKISGAHAKSKADLEASRKRLESIGEEAARLREMLFTVEAELACCRVENESLESKYVNMTSEKMDVERRLKVSSVAAAEVLEVRRKREHERDAAEVAFKKAKVLLRQ